MSDALLDRIAAASDLTELDSVRVALLGKSGEITARLKSLGSMDPNTRAAEAPKVHALREKVTGAIADRKASLEAAELESSSRPRQSTCRCPRRRGSAAPSTPSAR